MSCSCQRVANAPLEKHSHMVRPYKVGAQDRRAIGQIYIKLHQSGRMPFDNMRACVVVLSEAYIRGAPGRPPIGPPDLFGAD